MPQGELHQRQRTKNRALFAVLLGICVLLFCITLLKLS